MKIITHPAIIRNWTGGVLFLLLTTISASAFSNLAAEATLQSSNGQAGDAFGKSVGISGDTVVSGAYLEDSNATGVNGDDSNNSSLFSGAAYVYVRNGVTWGQQAYLKASNTGTIDNFGRTAGISGDTIVIGAPMEDSNATGINGNGSNDSAADSGAVYVFVRNGTNWSQQAYLKASNTGVDDRFGSAVAISGDTIVVGAVGEASNATGVNGNQTDNSLFGAGAAYVFVRNGTTWTQQGYLKASSIGSFGFSFGSSVAISSNTIVVGSPGEESAYVFVPNGTTWSQQAYLKTSNTEGGDGVGLSVSISSDTIVVGAYGEDSNATGVNGVQTNNLASRAGAAYVFVRSGTNWSQQAYLKASNTGADDLFGFSVVLADDNLVIGAIGEASNATGINGDQNNNSFSSAGAAYVFSRAGTNWSQQYYLKSSNPGLGSQLGEALAVSSNTVVMGYASSPTFGVGGEVYILAELYVPPSTPPIITLISMGPGFVDLQCLGTPDRFYDIERADDNIGNTFNVIDTQQAAPDGAFYSTDYSAPVAGAFYRLRQQ